MFDVVGKYKWDAWNSRKGMTCDEAKAAYFVKVEQMGFFKELKLEKTSAPAEGAPSPPHEPAAEEVKSADPVVDEGSTKLKTTPHVTVPL